MKLQIIKIILFISFLGFISAESSAQRTRPRRTGGQPTGNNPNVQQQNNNNTIPHYDPFANLPITYDTVSSNITTRKSLRNDNAFDKSSLTQRTPLPYEHLRWDDALFAHKVWRELDLREKINKVFQYEAEEDNGSQMFVNIVMKAIQDGEVTAFADDNFTTPLSKAEIDQLTAGKLDTFPIYDTKDIQKIIGWSVTRQSFDAKSITRLRLKEHWVFDKEASRLFCRILGIGFLKTEYFPNTTKERGTSSLFWVYYPDMRPIFARYEVYNPKNMGQSRMTWEELFESRMFSSYIVKSTLDNPSNKFIRNYISDPILRLLEGENIKEKIFNYEQDLWEY